MDFDQDIAWIINAFGKAAKDTRESNNLSRDALAQKLEISERQLRRIENEGQYPSLEVFLKIACMFHISVDELLFLPSGDPNAVVRNQLNRLLSQLRDEELEVLYSTAKGLLSVRR